MVASVLTKGFVSVQFVKLREVFGMKEIVEQSDCKWGGVLKSGTRVIFPNPFIL